MTTSKATHGAGDSARSGGRAVKASATAGFGHAEAGSRAVSPARLRWLESELLAWENEGLITRTAALGIRRRYTNDSRAKLLAIVTGLGVTFVAIGLIWLVAANLDQLHPFVRLAAVAALWLGLAVAGELFRSQRVAEVCRTLSAAAFGAVLFQAAQSLQVPAYEPLLLGCWGLGALAYAYATAGWGAFAVGLLTSAAWFAWQAGESVRSAPEASLVAMFGAVAATSVALAHRGRVEAVRPGFAKGWRMISATMALVGLFIAAIPMGSSTEPLWRPMLLWTAGVAVIAAVIGIGAAAAAGRAAGATQGARPGAYASSGGDTAGASAESAASAAPAASGATRQPGLGTGEPKGPAGSLGRASLEIIVLVVLTGLAAGLALWQPTTDTIFGYDPTAMSPETWARTGASIVVYLVAVAWFAVLGSWREAQGLTTIAMAALVLFTAFQSFAVFAPIISGATLFLAVGAVMLVTGLAAERLRRLLRRRGNGRRRRTSADTATPPVATEAPEPKATIAREGQQGLDAGGPVTTPEAPASTNESEERP